VKKYRLVEIVWVDAEEIGDVGWNSLKEMKAAARLKKAKLGELRFTVDSKGKMWAWDSDHDLHDAVIFGMTGQKYNGDYAKGSIGFIDIDGDDNPTKIRREGNLRIITYNSRTVGTDYALKNRTMKALAKRINSAGKDKVYWKDV
jgi:anaerobic glycerol-3-phosphate dehydrogenase